MNRIMSITRKSLGRAAIAAALLAGIPFAASAQIAVRQEVKADDAASQDMLQQQNRTTAETDAKQGNSPYFALKTNVLSIAALTPSLGLEAGLGRKTSFDLYGAYNNWTLKDNKKWKHWNVQPAIRFWTCERFNGSFFGIHLQGGEFNVGGVGPFQKLKDYRYDGWFVGGGVSYGYQWILSNRMALEAEIGVGYARMWYDQFGCAECAPKIGEGTYNYFGPTKAAVSLIVFLR